MNVALHDNGGVADGGVNPSGPELIEVVVIDTPKAVGLVRSAVYIANCSRICPRQQLFFQQRSAGRKTVIGAVARVIDVPSQPTKLNIFRRSGRH